MISSNGEGDRILLPPERFYWAVLDRSMLPQRRSTSEQLGFLFENVLPISVDGIHAVYVNLKSPRVLACGIERDRLEQELSPPERRLACIHLGPDGIPALAAADVPPLHINMLSGPFESPKIRIMRRRWHLQLLATVLVCTTLIGAGIFKALANIKAESMAVLDRKASIMRDVLDVAPDPGESAASSDQPLELRLSAELRRLRQTRQRPARDAETIDAPAMLTALLTHWPSDMMVQTEAVTVTSSTLTVRANVPTSSDVQHLADALTLPEPWRLQQPQVSASRDSVQATLMWKKAGATQE